LTAHGATIRHVSDQPRDQQGRYASSASFDEQLRAHRAARRIRPPWDRQPPAAGPVPAAGTFTSIPQRPDPLAGADFLQRAVAARRARPSETTIDAEVPDR